MMKRAIPALILALGLSMPAMAGTCSEDMAKVTTALESMELSDDLRSRVKEQVDKAKSEESAGNEEACVATLSEVITALGIE